MKTINYSESNIKKIRSNSTLDDSIFEGLPPLLSQIIEPVKTQKRKRDVLFLSAFTMLTAGIVNVVGFYHNKKVMCCSYLFIVAPPASNKSYATFATHLLYKLDKYYKSLNQNDALKNKKKILIPENISSAGMIELIAHNKSCALFSSEADTLTNIMTNDWGDWSDLMRKIFHHEPFAVYRKNENNIPEIYDGENKLSIELCGTIDQLITFLKQRENGLVSRFSFYYFDVVSKFKNPFKNNADLGHYYTELGDEVLNMYKKLSSLETPRIFTLNKQQIIRFTEYFTNKTEQIKIITGENVNDIIFRLGLSAYRFAMFISILRDYNGEGKLTCTDEDLERSLKLTSCLIENGLSIVSILGNNKHQSTEQIVYSKIPDNFQTKDVIEGFSAIYQERQANRILREWVEKGSVYKIKTGFYKKVKQSI
jgi:hypothetical protein